jgi:hypothetical protein
MSINLLPSSGSPAPMSGEDDLRFLYEQARRYVVAKPWEPFANASLHLDLKVGSWHEACAQHISNGPLNALLVFPGRQNMLGLHKAGLAEPPAGTIFVELVVGEPMDGSHEALEHGWPADLTPIPHFKAITPDGWLPLERGQMRVLALALAAISDFKSAAASDMTTEVAGEAIMPGSTRGRYRARLAPADGDGLVPIMGIPRGDLYGDLDCTVSFTNVPSRTYRALREYARSFRAAKPPLLDRRESILLVTISAPPVEAAAIAARLTAAEPLGVTFAEMNGVLVAILIGLKDSYVLVEATEHREELMLWQHEAKSMLGGHAVLVEDKVSDPDSVDLSTWSLHAIFECSSGKY